MTFDEAKAWLLSFVKGSSLSPYQELHLDRDAWAKARTDAVPYCRLEGREEHGGIFLSKDGKPVYWVMGLDESDYIIEEPAAWWSGAFVQDRWSRECWFTGSPPWVVSRWYQKEGLL